MKLLDAYTLETPSDHRAVITDFLIDDEILTVATWNVGSRRIGRTLRSLLEVADVVMLQEVGDRRPRVRRIARKAGWAMRYRSRVAVLTRLRIVERDDQLLHGPRKGGPGAGPDTVKVKHLVGIRVRFAGQVVSVGSIHLVASSYRPLRKIIAFLETRRAAEWVRRQPGPVVLAGDMNTRPWSLILRVLLRAGLTHAHRLATHGRRCIDHVLYGGR